MQRLTSWTSVIIVVVLASAFAWPQAARAGDGAFRRGDVNLDGNLDLSDPVSTLLALFLGGEPGTCDDAGDANDDGRIDISDPLYLLTHLFLGGAAPSSPGMACGVDPTDDGLGCAGYWPCSVETGATEFSSPRSGAPGGYGRGTDDTAGGPPNGEAPPVPQEPQPAGGAERAIEESDIYRLEGDHLFVLNRYRGLQILDVADTSAPTMVGSVPIFGYPREMYVRGRTAYIIVSDYYEYWRDSSDTLPVNGFYGSQLRIVDISDVARPVVVGAVSKFT